VRTDAHRTCYSIASRVPRMRLGPQRSTDTFRFCRASRPDKSDFSEGSTPYIGSDMAAFVQKRDVKLQSTPYIGRPWRPRVRRDQLTVGSRGTSGGRAAAMPRLPAETDLRDRSTSCNRIPTAGRTDRTAVSGSGRQGPAASVIAHTAYGDRQILKRSGAISVNQK